MGIYQFNKIYGDKYDRSDVIFSGKKIGTIRKLIDFFSTDDINGVVGWKYYKKGENVGSEVFPSYIVAKDWVEKTIFNFKR